jgi:hypothetical protein
MKFLIIQENGRHEKNRIYRECFCVQRSLLKLNHECVVWGLGHDNFKSKIDFNSFDVIINLENYDTIGWVPNLKDVKSLKLLWSIDAHVKGIKSYLHIFNQGKYNLILQATKDYVNKESVWFPNCFDDTLIFKKDIPKRCDVGFCGNIVNRKVYLDFLKQEFNFISDIFVIGDDMVNAINSYRIHFNKNIKNDINYRNFETIGCGVLLLTNRNDQYSDLGFIDQKNCIMYDNIKDLKSKIELLLCTNEELKKISFEGLELSKRHTYDRRIKELLNILEDRI